MKSLNHKVKDKELPLVFNNEMIFEENNGDIVFKESSKKIIKS